MGLEVTRNKYFAGLKLIFRVSVLCLSISFFTNMLLSLPTFEEKYFHFLVFTWKNIIDTFVLKRVERDIVQQ